MLSDLDDVIAGVLVGDKAAISRALNLVEDRRPSAREPVRLLLAGLAEGGRSELGHRIGLTGPPGVGKSTLAACLGRALRARGSTVGVVAVDPSSVRSGGALLGDRARMSFDPADAGLFMRSLATAGDPGGLSWAANAAVRVLAGAYDMVIVETTGVGQTETDVEHVADSVALVLQPGSGDTLQFLKAGIMEIPDLLVVNKADLGALARRTVGDLEGALASGGRAGVGPERKVPILCTSARDGEGVDELVHALDTHRSALGEEGVATRRGAGRVAWATALVHRAWGEEGVAVLGGADALCSRITAEVDDGGQPLEIAQELGREIMERFRT